VTDEELLTTWDIEREAVVGFIDFGGLNEHFLALTPERLQTVSRDLETDTVYLRDVITGELQMSFAGHSGPIVDVEFPEFTNRMVTASLDTTTIIWNRETGQIEETVVLDAPYRSIGVAPDGNLILFGLTDGTLILYDVGREFEVGRWRGHSDYINDVLFTRDGGPPPTALAASDDGTMRLWELSPVNDQVSLWVEDNRWVRPISCEEIGILAVDIPCEEDALSPPEPST
jgi:WD40 repeat protein